MTPGRPQTGPDGTATTWTGTARRLRVVRGWLLYAAGAAALVALVGLLPSSDTTSTWSDVVLFGFVGVAILVSALIGLVSVKPVTLTLDTAQVTVVRADHRVTAALADLAWPDAQLFGEAVLVTRPTTPREGPRAAVIIDLLSFSRAQRRQILNALRHALDSQAEPLPPDRAWPRLRLTHPNRLARSAAARNLQ